MFNLSIDENAPKQHNGHDCGVFVYMYAHDFETIGRINDSTSIQKNASYFRLYMLFQFIQEINRIEIVKNNNNTINLIVSDDNNEAVIDEKSMLTNIMKSQLSSIKDVIELKYEGQIHKEANILNDIDLAESNFFRNLEYKMELDLNNENINHDELFDCSIGVNQDESFSTTIDENFLRNVVTKFIKADKAAKALLKEAGENLQMILFSISNSILIVKHVNN